MRLLFVTLLVLNGGYLGFNLWDAQRDNGDVDAFEPVDGIPELRLIGAVAGAEKGESEPSDVRVVQPELERRQQDEPVRAECFVLGPVASSDIVSAMESRAREHGLHAIDSWSRETDMPRYWVHLAPADDMGAARDAIATLQEAGESDVQLISSGGMARGVSLGLFSTRDAAERRQTVIQKLGFPAEINDVAVRADGYWLGLRSTNGKAPGEDVLRAIIANDSVPHETRPCDELPPS